MLTKHFSAALLCGTAAAQVTFPVTTQTSFPAPACTSGPQTTEQFTVNYNFETVERGDPLTGITSIGEYNLLNFTNINWVDTDPDFDGNHLGLAPHTYPDVATFGAGTSSLTNSTPLITADYIESTLTSFTARSFWYGCVLPSPYTAGSLPVACNITATGYSRDGHPLAVQNFEFMTNGSVVQDQKFGEFKGFTNVRSVGFSVTPANIGAALIDNFIATLYQPACAPYYTGSYENGT
ncbi:Herpes-BLLF1 multi-domain [Lecanosticta acicola]|uniref:Herpes-BLLF1 multi-domain n=1 Tax=Lecanosticta acicola TaxID=111012 RepID=A0AAI8YRZ1_9PEZI|nr:Herpes-BLLF1 multi-domain [Lecanosticta acicola]